MKKFNILFILLSIILTSCSNEDDPSNNYTSEDILGTWILTDLTLTGQIEAEIQGQTINSTITGEGYDITSTLTFNQSPNTITSLGNLNMTLSYSLGGNTITDDVENFEFLDGGIWEINDGNLMITESDETTQAQIIKLTNNELILKVSETEVETEDGETTTSTFEILAEFVR